MKNYFFSSEVWIAKAGVEPWLLFLFFLLEPALVALFLLMFLVLIVLEPISCLFLNRLSKRTFIHMGAIFVKITFIFPLLSMANDNYYFSKGEQRIIEIPCQMTKISMGNQDVTSYKYLKSSKQLLVKAKSGGTSDIIMWCGATKKQFRFHVITKTKQLKLEQITSELKDTQLEVKVVGKLIFIEGIIEKLKTYKLLSVLKKSEKGLLLIKATLTPSLKNEIAKSIYEFAYLNGVSFINCQLNQIEFYCQYRAQKDEKKKLSPLLQKFFIHFQFINHHNENKRFMAKVFFYQFRVSDGDFSQFPLGQFSALLSNGSFQGRIGETIKLNGHEMKVQQVASPQISLALGKKVSVKMGTEIPFEVLSENVQKIDWKFAGLDLNFNVNGQGSVYQVDYKTTLSLPHNDNIISNSKVSSVKLRENEVTPFFSSVVTTNTVQKSHLPYLKYIPILGALGKYTNATEKIYLIGYFKLESVDL